MTTATSNLLCGFVYAAYTGFSKTKWGSFIQCKPEATNLFLSTTDYSIAFVC